MAKGKKRKTPPTIPQQLQETPGSSAQSEKYDNCDSKESSRLESSATGSSGSALDMKNATKVKKNQIISESCDATQKLTEQGNLGTPDETNIKSFEQDKTSSLLKIVEVGTRGEMYPEESIGGNPTSLVEMKRHVPLQNMGSDPMKNNVPSEMISLDVKMISNSFQAREDNQIENKNNLHSENDMQSKDDDPTISLHAVQDSPVTPVDSDSNGHLNKVYSSKRKKNKKDKKEECAIDEDGEHKDIDGARHNVPPEMISLDVKMISNSFQSREDNQIENKNNLCSESDMQSKDDDPTISLHAVQDSPVTPVDGDSIGHLNKVYSSKRKRKKKKKTECTIDEDRVHKEIDRAKHNVPPEMISLDVKMISNSFQAREDNQIENKNNLHSENDMQSKDDDPTISLHAVQDSPVNGASIGHLNKVYSSKKKKKKKKAECTIDEDRVCKDIDGARHNVLLGNIDADMMKNNAPPNMHPLDKKIIDISFQARERGDSQLKKKNDLPSENYMETITDDPNTSLQSVQDSPVDSTSIRCLNKVYASKKTMKKKKAEWTAHEDKVCKNSSTIDLLHECLVEKSVDELNSFQMDVEECNASKKEKMEVSPTNCKEEASVYGTSLKVLDTDVVNISASGSGDKELASTRENTMEEKIGDNFCNLPRAVPECDLVEANLGSCSTDCQKGSKNNPENGGSGQEKLLDLSLPPEKAPLSCNRSRRKLLILDLNGLLVDMVNYQSNWRKPDTIIGGKSVYKRRFCDDFLKFCFERFDVGIWTSRTKRNMHAVLDFLMRDDMCKLLFFWDQSQCTSTGFTTVENEDKPLFLKELKKIWNKEVPSLPWEKGDYTPSNTLLLDDSPYKALRNPPYTAVFPWSYSFKYLSDNSLARGGDLRVYLEGLAKCDDVPRYVQEHPFGQRAITSSSASWKFYQKVMGAENSSS